MSRSNKEKLNRAESGTRLKSIRNGFVKEIDRTNPEKNTKVLSRD